MIYKLQYICMVELLTSCPWTDFMVVEQPFFSHLRLVFSLLYKWRLISQIPHYNKSQGFLRLGQHWSLSTSCSSVCHISQQDRYNIPVAQNDLELLNKIRYFTEGKAQKHALKVSQRVPVLKGTSLVSLTVLRSSVYWAAIHPCVYINFSFLCIFDIPSI